MTLRDPLTFLLIVVLGLAAWFELFDVFLVRHARDCHAANEEMLVHQREGPLNARC